MASGSRRIGLTEDEAEGIYDFLCLETHPQSFASHQHATWEDDAQGLYVTDMVTLTKLILVSLVGVLDLAELLYAYHGWDVLDLAAIGSAADALWPGEND